MTDRPDTNSVVAGLLRDLANVQKSSQSKWGYKRAASAIARLDAPIETYLQPDGTLRKIPHIGPSSTRVILEVLQTGSSATVEQAIADSSKRQDVEKSRGLRTGFLSRAEVNAALADRRLTGPALADYRGDLQMHSVWSDGIQTLEEIVEIGVSRGYQYSAITDHSYGLAIARGMSMDRAAEQHREIDRLNRTQRKRYRLIKGIEANIRADGQIDMTGDELRRFELVVAAPHAVLRSPDDQTARMLAAVTTPAVHILGHPRGRMYGSRPGITARWSEVFAAASRTGVAIEIDGDPSRQDVDHRLARQALDAGCLFALDSDAHGPADWVFAETAVAHARLAGIPRERIINCWPLEELLAWAATRRMATPSPATPPGRGRR